MKLYDFALVAFILFVANCFQFEAAKKQCEKINYEGKGCDVHRKLKESETKKLTISYK